MLWRRMGIWEKLSTEIKKVINSLCITIHTSKGVDSWNTRVGIE